MPTNDKNHSRALRPGHALLWYRIKEVLGEGSFGITYLCEDSNLNRLVAIKEYAPQPFTRREADHRLVPISDANVEDFVHGLEHFVRQAEILDRIEHPSIVRVIDVFEANNTAYMVMHYEQGESLSARLARKTTLNESELRGILFPVLDSLGAIHRARILHRDLNPDNLYLREDGSPVLLEFGSGRHALGAEHPTLANRVSPGYVPIEQYLGADSRIGPWTDLYGLGATVYRAVTGSAPADVMARIAAGLRNAPDPYVPAVRRAKGLYSVDLLQAIDYALEIEPAQRPQSADQWGAALKLQTSVAELTNGAHPTRLPLAPQDVRGSPLGSQPELDLNRNDASQSDSSCVRSPEQATQAWRSRGRHFVFGTLAAGAAFGWILLAEHQQAGSATQSGSGTAYTEVRHQSPPAPVKPIVDEVREEPPEPISEPTSPNRSRDQQSPLAQASQVAHIPPLASDSVIPNATEATNASAVIALGEPPRSEANATRIAWLLSQATHDIAALRLSVPIHSNALAKYREVLVLDPTSSLAIQGMETIVDKYLGLIYRAIETNRLGQAELYLRRAGKISPQDQDLHRAWQALLARRYKQARGPE